MGLIINAAAGNRFASLEAASVYEWATYGVKQRTGGGLLASSNHFVDPTWTGLPAIGDGASGGFSKERLANLLARGAQYEGTIDATRMMQIFDTTIPDGAPPSPTRAPWRPIIRSSRRPATAPCGRNPPPTFDVG